MGNQRIDPDSKFGDLSKSHPVLEREMQPNCRRECQQLFLKIYDPTILKLLETDSNHFAFKAMKN
jgi:hypothetical protein